MTDPASAEPHVQPGNRIRLFGGYDPEPAWLNGRRCVDGVLARFIPGQNAAPAAVVQLDTRHSSSLGNGSVAVLELRYEGATWSRTGVVHVELCDFDPPSVRWQDRQQRGAWVESHATYELL